MSNTILTAEQSKLIEDNIEFCYWYFNQHGIYSEDRRQTLLLELCEFVNLYDKNRGAFTTFIATVFKTGNLKQIKKENAKFRAADKLAISMDAIVSTAPDGSELTLADILDDTNDKLCAIVDKNVITNIINNLSKHNKITNDDFMTFITFLKTNSLTFTGRLFNISKEGARRRCKKVRDLIIKDQLDSNKIPNKLIRKNKLDCFNNKNFTIDNIVNELCN